MDSRIRDLSAYRFEKAEKTLELAKRLLKEKECGFASNRAYYSAFYAMRAMNALDSFDSSKHSGVVAHFNQYYIRTGIIPENCSAIVRRASKLRERSDYEDYYTPDFNSVEKTIVAVENFIEEVKTYLKSENII